MNRCNRSRIAGAALVALALIAGHGRAVRPAEAELVRDLTVSIEAPLQVKAGEVFTCTVRLSETSGGTVLFCPSVPDCAALQAFVSPQITVLRYTAVATKGVTPTCTLTSTLVSCWKSKVAPYEVITLTVTAQVQRSTGLRRITARVDPFYRVDETAAGGEENNGASHAIEVVP